MFSKNRGLNGQSLGLCLHTGSSASLVLGQFESALQSVRVRRNLQVGVCRLTIEVCLFILVCRRCCSSAGRVRPW